MTTAEVHSTAAAAGAVLRNSCYSISRGSSSNSSDCHEKTGVVSEDDVAGRTAAEAVAHGAAAV